MKLFRLILIVAAITAADRALAQENLIYVQIMCGGSWYNKEGDINSDYSLGIAGGYQASPNLSFEGHAVYMPVESDQYYFLAVGARYSFIGADFFMTPSIGLHGGALVPMGDKKDVDGLVGMSAMLLYHNKRWGFELGPEVMGSAVFEGPHIAAWVNYAGVLRFHF